MPCSIFSRKFIPQQRVCLAIITRYSTNFSLGGVEKAAGAANARSYKINAQDVICSLNMALLFVQDSGAGKNRRALRLPRSPRDAQSDVAAAMKNVH